MNRVQEHLIQLSGRVAAEELNAGSPLEITLVRGDAATTFVKVRTDQSGLIGLIRHLHGQGFVLLSVNPADARGQGGSDGD